MHRLGRAYSHEGVIESSLGDIGIYYPDEDGELLKRCVEKVFIN